MLLLKLRFLKCFIFIHGFWQTPIQLLKQNPRNLLFQNVTKKRLLKYTSFTNLCVFKFTSYFGEHLFTHLNIVSLSERIRTHSCSPRCSKGRWKIFLKGEIHICTLYVCTYTHEYMHMHTCTHTDTENKQNNTLTTGVKILEEIIIQKRI